MAVTTAFSNALALSQYKLYYVIEIELDSGNRYYTSRATSEPANSYSYISKEPKATEQTIDIIEASSTFSTLEFTLIDKDGFVTADMFLEAYLNKPVNLYVMFDGLTFATDAIRTFTGRLDQMTVNQFEISFSARELLSDAFTSMYDGISNLNGLINTVATDIVVDDISVFNESGTLKIEDEYITYTGRNTSTNTFTGVVRNAFSSIAANHDDNTEIQQVFTATAINPITLLLRLLLSIDGDGSNSATYDVLAEGIGLDPNDIDIASFTAIRDASTFGTYSIVSDSDMSNSLDFIQNQILLPTFTRIVTSYEGKLTLVEIDQAVIDPQMSVIDNDTVLKDAQLESTSRDIVNEVTIQYNYDHLTDTYGNTLTEIDDGSVTEFGTTPNSKKDFTFKGMNTSIQATNFATSFLARNSTPLFTLTFNTMLKKRLINAGDNILLTTKNLTNLNDGSTDFDQLLEVLSMSQEKDEISFTCASTRYTLGRAGFISPSETISANASGATILTVGDASNFKVGFTVQLQRNDTKAFESGFKTVTVVDTTLNKVTINSAFSATIVNGTHQLTYANYADTQVGFERYWACIIDGSGDCKDQLNGSLTSSATTITVDSTSDFPSSGYIKIDLEQISYASKNSTQFLTCTRGYNSTTAASHLDNAMVSEIFYDGKPPYSIKN